MSGRMRRKPVGPLTGNLARRAFMRPAWESHVVTDLTDLRDAMRQFTDARDWAQFHDPKSLILALVGEVGELAELFQWLPAESARDTAQAEPLRTRVGEELADVLLYLVRLADVLDVDLHAAASAKLGHSEKRFVAADVRGKAPAKS